MKGALLVLALIVAGVVGLGFYLGWWYLSVTPTMRTSLSRWTRPKSKRIKTKRWTKVQDLGQAAKDKVETTTQKAQD
jgi:hypothetical protein